MSTKQNSSKSTRKITKSAVEGAGSAGAYVEIACIIDRSGSMSAIKKDAIGGFNEFLAGQQKVEGKARLTLVLFDDQYDMVHDGVDLQAVAPFTGESYVPRGHTAMLDAIGKTLSTINDRIMRTLASERPDKVIIAILTDGEENASLEYSRKAVSKMIAQLKKERHWEFFFLAANQDVVEAAASLSIDHNSSISFRSEGQDTRRAFREMNWRFSTSRRN